MHSKISFLLITVVLCVFCFGSIEYQSGVNISFSFVSDAEASSNKLPPPPKLKNKKQQSKKKAKKKNLSFKNKGKGKKKANLKPKAKATNDKSLRPKKDLRPKQAKASSSRGLRSFAEKENKRLKANGYAYPPYKRGSQVITRTTSKPENFIRVYSNGKTAGKFLLKAKDINGLTPKQIQNKYGLPSTPTHFVNVKVPSGIKMSIGVAAAKQNSVFPRGKGGGIQYELRQNINFPSTGKKLPNVFKGSLNG